MTTNTIEPTKRCSKCGEMKPLTAFRKQRSGPMGHRSACRACLSPDDAAYRETHPDHNAAWMAANPERRAQHCATYYLRHTARARAATRKWESENRDKVTAKLVRWVIKHPDRVLAKAKKYRDANPDVMTEQGRRRRARKRAAPGKHTLAETRTLLVNQRHLCANPHCRADLRLTKRALDHVKALKLGGSDGIENLQRLCQPCNQRKSYLPQDEWLNREALLARKAA